MKKLSILCAITLCGGAVFSQSLITYGNSETGKDEFLRAYNKNKPATTDKEKSMRDYLELYTNFKLKVKAAEELRLDTIPQLKYDIQNFRDQITENYLSDEKGMQQLVDEAATRSGKDIHVIYFSVPVAENTAPADTMKAYTAAKELYNALKKGSTDYAAIVTEISAKNYPSKYSDAGFITAFSVPYEYENIIYNTKPGNVSEPYRGTKGWNIFKVTEEKPDEGKWKAAQILFAYPPEADYNTKLAIKQKADSVYTLLQNGLSFADAAKQFSDDRITYIAGGELPEFGTGRYNSVFENNVFSLQKDNDMTKPFETAYGYHIVKRLSHIMPPADKNDGTYQFEIKQKVLQDSRMNNQKEQFAKQVAGRIGYKRSADVNDADLFRYADTVLKNTAADVDAFPISKKTIITFKDGTQIKGNDWLKFIKEYRLTPDQKTEFNKKLWDKFTSQSVMNYYKKHLEEYNDDFKYQMQEFKEGNMLFEIMERNVWSKAGTDSAGLTKYYNEHKTNYKWAASADVLIFNCTDEKKASDAIAALKAGKTWQELAENSNNQIQADSGRYELSQIPGTAPVTNPQAGTYSAVIKNADGTAAFVKYIKIYAPDLQRSFPEARGLVINDYQNVLEQQWIDSLRKKYPVKVNEAVFNKMLH